jgi:hypothetical protein
LQRGANLAGAAMYDPKHLNPREGITTVCICFFTGKPAHGVSKAPQSPRGDYDTLTRRTLPRAGETIQSTSIPARGLRLLAFIDGLAGRALAAGSKAPQSPRGDYDRDKDRFVRAALASNIQSTSIPARGLRPTGWACPGQRRIWHPKHLNPREGITTPRPLTTDDKEVIRIQSTSIPARGLRPSLGCAIGRNISSRSKAPQSPRGDYDEVATGPTFDETLTRIQSTSIPARGLRRQKLEQFLRELLRLHPKHLNPREGITTGTSRVTSKVCSISIQSTSIPARGLRLGPRCWRHRPSAPADPKHLNPREGITTQRSSRR